MVERQFLRNQKRKNPIQYVLHTYTHTTTTDYDDCLAIFEKFCVLFVLNQAHCKYDRPSQQEEHTEVKQGDSSIQTFISISVKGRRGNIYCEYTQLAVPIWTLEFNHLKAIYKPFALQLISQNQLSIFLLFYFYLDLIF